MTHQMKPCNCFIGVLVALSYEANHHPQPIKGIYIRRLQCAVWLLDGIFASWTHWLSL